MDHTLEAQFAQCAETTQRALLDAGWNPQRHVDSTDVIHELLTHGHPVHAAARAFLDSFLGIHVCWRYIHTPTQTSITTDIVIDPLRASTRIEAPLAAHLTRIVNEAVCPIGLSNSMHDTHFVGASGKVYDWYEGGVWLCGLNSLSFFDTMIAGGPITLLHQDDR